MPTAQLAELPPPPSPAKTEAKARKPERASQSPPIDLAKETLSVPEASRLLDQEEWILRMLCRDGSIPSHEINGEFHIPLPDLFAFRREQQAIFDKLNSDDFMDQMADISAKLERQGLQ